MGKPAELALKTTCFPVAIWKLVGSSDFDGFPGNYRDHTTTERLWKVCYRDHDVSRRGAEVSLLDEGEYR